MSPFFRRLLVVERQLLFTATLLLLVPAATAQRLSVTATRLSGQPLIVPSADEHGVFNPAAARVDGKIVLLTRDQDEAGVSSIGYAESADGMHFTRDAKPVLQAEAPYELHGGVEDPRLVQISDLWYLTYTGYNGKDAQLCLATSHDLKHWERKGVILPAYQGTWNKRRTKSGAIVPEKIRGRWWMYYLGTKADGRDYMGLASSDDLLHWKDATAEPVLPRREREFDEQVMEPGPSPILTPQGILLLYNGANQKLVYGPGWALFDLNDPSKLLARSDGAFLKPELEWEKVGQVPNVIFLEGAVEEGSSDTGLGGSTSLLAYYGAADTRIGSARVIIGYALHQERAVDSIPLESKP